MYRFAGSLLVNPSMSSNVPSHTGIKKGGRNDVSFEFGTTSSASSHSGKMVVIFVVFYLSISL